MAECMEVLKWEKFLLPHNYVCVIITFSEAVGLVRPKNEAFLTSLDLNYSCDKIIKFKFDVDGYQHSVCANSQCILSSAPWLIHQVSR